MFPTEPAAVNNGFSALLKNRGFMLLWIGQILSQLGDKLHHKPLPLMGFLIMSLVLVLPIIYF